MSRKSKLLRFAELDSFSNSFQCSDPSSSQVRKSDGNFDSFKGHWHEKAFDNINPIILELACGKGEYTIALAQAHSNKNFIGVDIKGNRIHRGAKKGLTLGLKNAAFLRIRIEWIMNHFAPGELSEIWITFPDPFLKDSKENRRLTSPMFLDRYKILLAKDGIAQLKTDSPELYNYTIETLLSRKDLTILKKSDDIDRDGLTQGDLAIQTYYEGLHREAGKKIKYVSWKYIE